MRGSLKQNGLSFFWSKKSCLDNNNMQVPDGREFSFVLRVVAVSPVI